MRAIGIDAFDAPPAPLDLPAPKPRADEVLIRVQASAVNPVDSAIAAGVLKSMFAYEFPVVLGRDYAGVVELVGADVTRYAVGDEVFGFVPHANPAVHDGAWAEFVVVPERMWITRKPSGADAASAGAAGLAGVAALTAVEALGLRDGDTLLLVGATGGVGSCAVQLAAHAGATIIAPALPEDEEYLHGLGVDEVLPRDGDVVSAARERHPDGVDAVLDAVSFTPGAFDGALKDGGRVSSTTGSAGDGPGRTNVVASPTTDDLERLAALLASGTVTVAIQESYELERAPEAMAALGARHTRGKLGIRI